MESFHLIKSIHKTLKSSYLMLRNWTVSPRDINKTRMAPLTTPILCHIESHQSLVQSLNHIRLCDHMDCSTARPPCPSPTLRVHSCPLSQWCHPTISSSVIPFSSSLRSFLVSGSFQMSQFLASGGQSIGVSASTSVLPMNIQDWFPLGWTGWISWKS